MEKNELFELPWFIEPPALHLLTKAAHQTELPPNCCLVFEQTLLQQTSHHSQVSYWLKGETYPAHSTASSKLLVRKPTRAKPSGAE